VRKKEKKKREEMLEETALLRKIFWSKGVSRGRYPRKKGKKKGERGKQAAA